MWTKMWVRNNAKLEVKPPWPIGHPFVARYALTRWWWTRSRLVNRKVVNIDESKFGKRKYHRGHRVEGQLVFGEVERDSGKCFMVPVESRDRETLLPIIKNWILPGSTVIFNCWKVYECLADEGYTHLKVSSSLEFVDPITGACTNKIEASWNAAKRTINPSGRRKSF